MELCTPALSLSHALFLCRSLLPVVIRAATSSAHLVAEYKCCSKSSSYICMYATYVCM